MQIKIGPCQYDVEFKELENDVCGEYSMKAGTIKIDVDMHEDIQRQTACHEIAHLCLRSLTIKDGEVSAEAMGNFLFQLILNNSEFCYWVQSLGEGRVTTGEDT